MSELEDDELTELELETLEDEEKLEREELEEELELNENEELELEEELVLELLESLASLESLDDEELSKAGSRIICSSQPLMPENAKSTNPRGEA